MRCPPLAHLDQRACRCSGSCCACSFAGRPPEGAPGLLAPPEQLAGRGEFRARSLHLEGFPPGPPAGAGDGLPCAFRAPRCISVIRFAKPTVLIGLKAGRVAHITKSEAGLLMIFNA